MTLSDLSLKRPVLATVVILALLVLGIFSYVSLNINDMPQIEIPYVGVTVIQPGVSPAQMETGVTKVVEDAVGQISGVKHITAYSYEGMTMITVEFTLETAPAEAVQNVRDKLGAIRGQLPTGIQDPVITKFDMNALPIVSLALSGNLSTREMTLLVNDLVKPRLEKISGVGKTAVYGAEQREIQIKLDKSKLAAYGLTTSDVLNSLRSQNMDYPAGKVSSGSHEVTLRTAGKITSIDQFGNLPVSRKDGVQLYIRDIATITDGTVQQTNLARYQGRPAIGIDLTKQSGSNTVAVADEAKVAVAELQHKLPPGVRLNVVSDNSVSIRNQVNETVRTIFEGSFLAILVVFLFLKDWRSTLISGLALPTSIIASFFAFKLLGFTLNMMTLMALSLAVGLLVDDAIVVIENIIRHLHMGKKPLDAARDGTAEISLAVMATTLTVVAVFLPVGVMTGITGRFFKEFGITVVFAVLVSLLVSFTLVPVLSSRNLQQGERTPRGPLGKFLNWFNQGFERLSGVYARLLSVVLQKRLLTMLLVLAMLIGSVMLVPRLGMTFIPDTDKGTLTITADLDSGLNLDTAGKMDKTLEQIIKKCPEVTQTYSTIQANKINIAVKLVDLQQRSRSAKQIASAIRQDLQAVPGMQTAVNTGSVMGSGKTVSYRLMGDNADQLQAYAEKAQHLMKDIPGVVDVSSSYKPGQPEVKVQIKQDAAADLGVSTAQVGDTLNTLFGGVVVGQYEEGEDRYDLRVRLGEGQRKSVEDLNGIFLSSQNKLDAGGSNLIPLSQVSQPVFSTGSSELGRFDKAKEIDLGANLEGITLGEFNTIFNQKVAQQLKMPAGYSFSQGAQSEMMGESFSTMGMSLLLGILFMFFVLAAQFESFIDPLAIILALPLAIIGAILGLFVGKSSISIMSLIGIIMLMGLVSKNAILLIDFAKGERGRGVERGAALINAARIRFRPIMMTSVAMILGMLPSAMAIGAGSEMRAPMAYAIIGGMITSTLLTLVVVPVIYTLLDDVRSKMSGKPEITYEEVTTHSM